MAQDITIPPNFGAVSTKFANVGYVDELGAGIVGGFAVLGYKGKVWRVKYRGEDTILMDDRNNAAPSVELVVLKASPLLSKLYYKKGFVEGSTERPDCWSNNSIAPDKAVPEPVNPTCANCPMNAFGSRITEAGKQGKACSDHKRLAVAPLADLENEYYGGPLMLRVPADSLKEIAAYDVKLKQMGWPYFGVATVVRFDHEAAHPRLLFSPLRPLNDTEADVILRLRESPQVERILMTEPEAVPAERDMSGFEQASPASPAAQPAVQPKPPAPPRPQPVAQPTATPAPQTNGATPPASTQVRAGAFGPRPQAVPPATPAPPRAGGFARPAAVAAPAQGSITAAVAAPVARPPTARKAAPAPVQTQPEPVQEEMFEDGGEEEGGQGGGLPPELDDDLNKLLS